MSKISILKAILLSTCLTACSAFFATTSSCGKNEADNLPTIEGVSFAGRNIFSDCHEDLEIFVPADKLNAIKDSVIYDKDIVDRIKAIA